MSIENDETLVDAFCQALWLEEGLAQNTLAAYRSDLLLLADWLHSQEKTVLRQAQPEQLQAWLSDPALAQIGRASCRETVQIDEGHTAREKTNREHPRKQNNTLDH